MWAPHMTVREFSLCVQELPQCIGELQNLHILSVDGCSMLRQLPNGCCLAALSELNLEGPSHSHSNITCIAHLLPLSFTFV